MQRIQRSRAFLPYLLLTHGPTIEPCPLHARLHGLLLPVDDPFWARSQLRMHQGCRCNLRQVGRVEFKKLTAEGVPHVVGRVFNPATGLPTGHLIHEKRPAILIAPDSS